MFEPFLQDCRGANATPTFAYFWSTKFALFLVELSLVYFWRNQVSLYPNVLDENKPYVTISYTGFCPKDVGSRSGVHQGVFGFLRSLSYE